MSVQTDPLPPVPEHAAPLTEDQISPEQGKLFSHPWTRWFTSLREKINILNESLVNLANLTGGPGFLVKSGGAWLLRTIVGTSGKISVTDGTGESGNPTVSLVPTGVTPGTYTSANIEVDEDGRILAATNGSGGGGGSYNYIDEDASDIYATEDLADLYIGQ